MSVSSIYVCFRKETYGSDSRKGNKARCYGIYEEVTQLVEIERD
jgi:hypothetical protein